MNQKLHWMDTKSDWIDRFLLSIDVYLKNSPDEYFEKFHNKIKMLKSSFNFFFLWWFIICLDCKVFIFCHQFNILFSECKIILWQFFEVTEIYLPYSRMYWKITLIIYCIALWLATFYHEIRVDYGVWSFQVLFLVNLYFWSDTFLNVLCQSKNYPIQEEKVIFPVSTLFHLNFVFQFDVVISLFISLFTKNCFNRKPL